MILARAVCVWLLVAGAAGAQLLTLPAGKRPDWLRREGLVMAGSWEPLLFRVRRDGSPGYVPSEQQQADYLREHSPEMIARLKDLGVNFVMAHAYKGAGLAAERSSMADAAAFAKRCHEAGLHVGVYLGSGTLLWELLFREVPQAKDWVLLDPDGAPLTYGRATWRYFWNRNHPEGAAYHRQAVRYAVEQIGADLIHFDNYIRGPGWDVHSQQRFREYLARTFTPQELKQAGIGDLAAVRAPAAGPADSLLRRAWLEFCCQALAESYWDVSRYARSLRPDVLIECNPGGVGPAVRPPVDHGRLLQGGEAFWDEGQRPGFRNGQLVSSIRTYKVARRMQNMAFRYTIRPLEMAESMAFNLDCLGCVCWFEYGRLATMPGAEAPPLESLGPYIRFFHARRDLLRDATVLADVAVLRSFPSQVLAEPKWAQLTNRVEDSLIAARFPFQIIYNQHLEDLDSYRAVVLAGCVALSDGQIDQLRGYVSSGGRLCLIGPAATHDQWMRPRARPALDDLAADRVVRVDEDGDALAAVEKAAGGRSLTVDAPPGVCTELTGQPGRRLVHLVNYREDGPAKDVAVRLRLPRGVRARSVTLVSPDRGRDLAVPCATVSGNVEFVVPVVGVYEIAVVALKE